eukprot:2523828-Rhodomonas_salina.1
MRCPVLPWRMLLPPSRVLCAVWYCDSVATSRPIHPLRHVRYGRRLCSYAPATACPVLNAVLLRHIWYWPFVRCYGKSGTDLGHVALPGARARVGRCSRAAAP